MCHQSCPTNQRRAALVGEPSAERRARHPMQARLGIPTVHRPSIARCLPVRCFRPGAMVQMLKRERILADQPAAVQLAVLCQRVQLLVKLVLVRLGPAQLASAPVVRHLTGADCVCFHRSESPLCRFRRNRPQRRKPEPVPVQERSTQGLPNRSRQHLPVLHRHRFPQYRAIATTFAPAKTLGRSRLDRRRASRFVHCPMVFRAFGKRRERPCRQQCR